MAVTLQAHSPAKPVPCHCSPNPHRPCTHTALSKAKKAAAAAKAKATNAAITAKATAELRAHPPTKAQIQTALAIQAYNKAHPKPRTKAQKAAGAKAAATRARHAKTHPPHKRAATKLHTSPKTPPLPLSFLQDAKKTIRAQMAAAAAAKIKHHRKKAAATNPHVKAMKRASTRKC